MAKVGTRLEELLREKEARDGVKITLEQLADDTKLSYGTILKWAKNQVARYDGDTLATLCEYFACEVGDVLVLIRE